MSSPLSNGLLAQSTIYKGLWINWAQGFVRGATLTTSKTTGAILVAFIALFIQFTGSRLWGILRFTIHQIKVTKRPQDGLYHQQQVVLRNFSPADAARSFMQVGWAWRSKIPNSVTRSLPLALVALVSWIVFLLAAILSAAASTSQGDEVLISSPYCGQINFATTNLTTVTNFYTDYATKSISDSASYARSCYISEGTGRTWQDCSTFPVPRLPTTQRNTSCPFDADICRAPAIQLDTGLMDSDLEFGINAPPKNRIGFRKVTTCAPIEVEKFSAIRQGSSQGSGYTQKSNLPELQYVELYYGGSRIIGTNGTFARNYTYNHHTFLLDFKYENENAYSDMFDYDLFSTGFEPLDDGSNFTPMSQLMREDAAVTLAFLSANSIPFSTPVDDPWYSAHSNPYQVLVNASALGDSSGSVGTSTISFRDRAVSVLACTEQYQICAPGSTPECTPLTGYVLLYESIQNLTLNAAQSATTEVLFSSYKNSIGGLISLLGTSALLARNSKFGSIQGFLPPNQWILEVESWNQILLANYQRLALEYATGPSDPVVLPMLVPPNGSYQEQLCHNQRARSTQAQNFSVLAIGIILGLGLLVTCVDLGLHRLISYIQREKDLRDYRRLVWKSDGLLQLHRMAYEEAGFGTWERCTKITPVTAQAQTLALLDVNNPEHPRLRKASVVPMQIVLPTPANAHTGTLQGGTGSDASALLAQTNPNPTVEVHVQHLNQASSTSDPNNTASSTTHPTISTPSEQSPSSRSRRHSL